MENLTEDQKKKLLRLAKIADDEFVGVIEELNTLEEKIEQVSEVAERKQEKGDKGESPSKAELLELIVPLIPIVKDGEDGEPGKNYVLTPADKKEIASSIAVPVVEKVIEKTEFIKEQPLITEITNEVENPVTGKEIVEKVNDLELIKELQIDIDHIKGFENSKLTDYIINRALSIVDQRTSFLINKVSNLQTTVNNIPTGGGDTSGLVPYVGANQDVTFATGATRTISIAPPADGNGNNLVLKAADGSGTGDGGEIQILGGSRSISGAGGDVLLRGGFGNNPALDGQIVFQDASTGFKVIFDTTDLTGDRVLNFNNLSGTFALLENINGAYVPYTGASSDVNLGVHDLTLTGQVIIANTGTVVADNAPFVIETLPDASDPTNATGLYLYRQGTTSGRIFLGKSGNAIWALNLTHVQGGIEGLNGLDLGVNGLSFGGSSHRIRRLPSGNGPELRFEANESGGVSFHTFYTHSLERMRIVDDGNIGIGVTAPTAALHLKASTSSADTASLKIEAGTVATVAVSGNIESDGTHLYWTDSGGNRRQLDN